MRGFFFFVTFIKLSQFQCRQNQCQNQYKNHQYRGNTGDEYAAVGSCPWETAVSQNNYGNKINIRIDYYEPAGNAGNDNTTKMLSLYYQNH